MKYHAFIPSAVLLFLSACGQPSPQTKSAEDSASDSASEQKTLQIDGMKVTWIQDLARNQALTVFPDASRELVDSLGLSTEVPSSISAFLVQKDSLRMLFDAGMGSPESRLLPILDSMGIDPSDITHLYITHFHGDHIGGMLDGDRTIFPNAAVYVSEPEYEAWMAMPSEKNAQVTKTMAAYRDRLHRFRFGETLPGEVQTLDAAGHTPGHTVFRIGKLLIIADLIHGAAIQLNHPDICATYDMDKNTAITARKRIMRYAEEERLTIAGMHLPAPGFIE